MPSSAVSVTATYKDVPATYYKLTVNSGTGGGDYLAGAVATISASAAPSGKMFDKWTGDTAYVGNINLSSTTLTMPSSAVAVTATYKDIPATYYTLTVNSGTGGGDYQAGSLVTISATAAVTGKMFDKWTGDTAYVTNINLSSTTVTMPSSAAAVTATYKDIPQILFALTVASGTGSGDYLAGAVITISAAAAAEGKMFDKWTGDAAYVANSNLSSTTLTMPASAATVTATYKNIPTTYYTLTVNSGTGGGEYLAGATVSISAAAAPSGKIFDKWTGDTASVANINLSSTTLMMPASSATISATYKDIPSTSYKLTVNSGVGSGTYKAGTLVVVSAAFPADGMFFDVWKGDVAGLANVTDANTTYLMPAADVTIRASYTQVPSPLYTLTVTGGSGSGVYRTGTPVPINANPPATGMQFDTWTGMTLGVSNPSLPNTVFTMPNSDASIGTVYKTAAQTLYTLAVDGGGVGGGRYLAGATVAVSAGLPAEGKVFLTWSGNIAGIASITSPNTTFTMPMGDAMLTPVFADKAKTLRTLTVKGGLGSGQYRAGDVVLISADVPKTGKAFEAWKGNTAYLDKPTCANAYVTMPAANIEFQSIYGDVTGTRHTLTVVDGLGSGSYKAGETITISAKPIYGENWCFDVWTGNVAGIANVNFPITTFSMPSYDATVMPNFKARDMENYTLVVEGGSGSGSYKAGVMVTISAATPPTGYVFDIWQGDTAWIGNPSIASTVVKIPQCALTVRASYRQMGSSYSLSVSNGSGSGSYPVGTSVAVAATTAPAGQVFAGWTGNTAYMVDPAIPNVSLVMPAADVRVAATYRSTEGLTLYTLNVVNGSGSGSYPEGTPIAITANTPPPNMVFDLWKPDVSNGVASQSAIMQVATSSTILVMPAQNMSVSAVYRKASNGKGYTLTVKTDAGQVIQQDTRKVGETVAVTAPEKLDDGRVFNSWRGAAVADLGAYATTLVMPEAETTLVATYRAGDDVVKVTINDGRRLYTIYVQRGSVLTLDALLRSNEGLLFQQWNSTELGKLLEERIVITADNDLTISASYLSVDSSYLLDLAASAPEYAAPAPRSALAVGFGESIDIWLDDLQGYRFKAWQLVSGSATIVEKGDSVGLATVTPTSDVSLLAQLQVGLTKGSVLTVDASDLQLTAFKSKPVVTAVLQSSGKKIGNLRVLTTGYTKKVVEQVECQWTRDLRLYKPSALNKLLREGVLTVDAMKQLLPGGFVDSAVNLKVNQDGKKWTGSAPVQALFIPVIKTLTTDSAGTSTASSAGASIAASGLLFGKTPSVYVEYQRKGSTSVHYRRCLIDTKSYIYKDWKGRPAAMNYSSGESYLRFTYPKMAASDVPTGYIVIDNRLARTAAKMDSGSSE